MTPDLEYLRGVFVGRYMTMKNQKVVSSFQGRARAFISAIAFGIITVFLVSCNGKSTTGKSFDYESIQYHKDSADEPVQKSVAVFAEFQNQLLGRLQAAMKSGGPVKAIEVCKIASPEIEQALSQDAEILRVSNKPRNPNHRASATESMVLDLWAKRLSQNQDIGPVVVPTETGRIVMSPIRIASQTCLSCHGSVEEIGPLTMAALQKEYPNDEAIGYSLNDLRGAFVARLHSK